ncbi:MAG: RraA family protein [Candidatus Thorarchaeota archaeon]
MGTQSEDPEEFNRSTAEAFAELSTPLVADACVRLKVPLRIAPPGIRPLEPGMKIAGKALPVRHYGSVDIFLEAVRSSNKGDIMVIDNGGKMDEGPVGDLTVLEMRAAGISGAIVWGAHRDGLELDKIGLPLFSYGSYPAGPTVLRARPTEALESALFGEELVTRQDVVFGDSDGVLFVASDRVSYVLESAHSIMETERRQVLAIQEGKTLSEQLRFDEYLKKREQDPSYTFRQHLRSIGGAIEE